MNYKHIYYKFIESFKLQEFAKGEYTEIHHINPKYKGGSDDSSNLVRVNYRQHVFLHKLFWKITGEPEARAAYLMMSGKTSEGRLAIASLGGKANAAKGNLDRVRHKANTPLRQRKLKELNKRKSVDKDFSALIGRRISESKRGATVPLDTRKRMSESHKNNFLSLEYKEEWLKRVQAESARSKSSKAESFSDSIWKKKDVCIEALSRDFNKRSKYYFISPDGISFESPTMLCEYYNLNPKDRIRERITNWCKQGKYGWGVRIKPKHD